MARTAERGHFEIPVRLQLVEKDLDRLDDGLATVAKRLDRILWALVGLLISVTTACILLAINLGVS